MFSRFLKFFFLSLILSGLLIFSVFAATSQGAVSVRVRVPASSGSGVAPPPPPATDNPPSISSVSITAGTSTARATWSASDTDTTGIASSNFIYGASLTYGSTGVISGGYEVNLTGLTPSTTYYFKIVVTDTKPQSSEYAGTFNTQAYTSPPPPVDIAPPTISFVNVATGITTATISWTIDESADGQILYGRTTNLGSTAVESSRAQSHSVLLIDLLPNTRYYYKIISSDAAANSASTTITSFSTSRDNAAPPDAAELRLSTTTASIILNWANPSLAVASDFVGVKVVRKTGGASANVSDGTLKYTGGAETHTDSSVSAGVRYYYTLFSYDTSGNYSPGTYVSGLIPSPPAPSENCAVAGDEDGNGQADCVDAVCASYPACVPTPETNCVNSLDDDRDGGIDCADSDCASAESCRPRAVEICNNNLDDDSDGAVDCNDANCDGSSFCLTGLTIENCSNGVDDDSDGRIDCGDSDCVGFSGCAITVTIFVCDDDVDNDGDGLIDYPADSGCANRNDTDEYNPPQVTVSEQARLSLGDVSITGPGGIALAPSNREFLSLAGMPLSVTISESVLGGSTSSLTLRLGGATHQFAYDSAARFYRANIQTPGIGNHEAYLEAQYANGQTDSLSFTIRSLGWGSVKGEESDVTLAARVTLMDVNGGLWNGASSGQTNPILTNENGIFGWMVPNGQYQLKLWSEGYYERISPVFTVSNNIINPSWSLVKQPPPLREVIDPNATVVENAVAVAQNVAEKTKAVAARTVQAVQRAADNPQVEKAAERVVAPVSVGVVAVGAVPLISWVDLIPLLRLLFFQPLLIIGKRERKGWGEVYNSLSKLPIDLATVRLVEADTGKILQSRVTDSKGRYAFKAKPGKYLLQAQKTQMKFPSALLSSLPVDGRRADIYHGEPITVSEQDVVITANIPLDPEGEHRTPARILWGRLSRKIQFIVSIIGIVITAGSLYISPRWYVAVLLGVHAAAFLLFLRLSMPKHVKSWGIAYDAENKNPVGRVVARLFNSQFNKLVSTEVTDRQGRYYFLAADGKYYVTYEHSDYVPEKSREVDLTGKDAEPIAIDVELKKV